MTPTTNVVPEVTASVTRSKWAALAVLALAQLMVVLDTTIVNVALPSIQRKLHFSSEANLQWVVNAYILTYGGFLLLGGRVADRYGRRLVSSRAWSSSLPPAWLVVWQTPRACWWLHG